MNFVLDLSHVTKIHLNVTNYFANKGVNHRHRKSEIVWSLDMSGEFHRKLDYTPCYETIYKDIALFLRISSDKINEKRKIDKFSNYILYTQRETWSNWWCTSRLKRHTHNSTVEDRKRIIFNKIKVQCLRGSFAFARQKMMKRHEPAQKFWNTKSQSKNRLKIYLYDRVWPVVFTTTSYPSLRSSSPSLSSPPSVIPLCLPQCW